MRKAELSRRTTETDVSVKLALDGAGASRVNTGCAFLDHMLTLWARHGRFDLTVTAKGDTEVDYHHTVEDVGLVLGEAFASALGDKKGIARYGDAVLPMDEALILSAVDISSRPYLGCELAIPTQKVGDFDTELCEEFWQAFVRRAQITLHIRQLAGRNSHHILEGVFKSAARSLRQAVALEERFADEVPSTKGVIG